MKTTKKVLAIAAAATSLLCANLPAQAFHLFKSNKIYTFNCPTPKMVLANANAHAPLYYIAFSKNQAQSEWVPPELEMRGNMPANITPAKFGKYEAVLFGQEVRCVYHSKVVDIVLRLEPPELYRNPVVGCQGNAHCIQLEQ